MSEKSEAQKKAQKKYIEKFSRVEIRMSTEKHNIIQTHANEHGESVNGFINRAIDETIARDDEKANPIQEKPTTEEPEEDPS